MRTLKNLKKILFDRKIGFVFLPLSGEVVPFNEPKSFLEKKLIPPKSFTLLDFAEFTQSAIKDKRIKGIYIQLVDFKTTLADLFELRKQFEKWRKNGKKVWIHAPEYSLQNYYLASVADKIILSPGGILATIGLSLNVKYYTKLFKKHGIKIEVVHVSRYKSALNRYSFEEMPEEEKEMLTWLGKDVFNTMIETIAHSKNKNKEEVLALIDSSPLTDKEALEQKWVDMILNTEEVASKIKELYGKKTPITSYILSKKKAKILKKSKRRIAIIPAIGGIIDGENKTYPIKIPLFGERQIGDLTIGDIVRRIRKNKKKYKAVIVFDDSPGGSATASESIYNELKQLNKEVPVYFYFHSIAGSGGYYIAMGGTKIISTPLTITGSIGVIAGKPVLEKFYEEQGIQPYEFNFGKNASLMSTANPWNDEQRKLIQKTIFHTYNLFLERVSNNRKIPVEKIKPVAAGKIWTGKQALEKGLVDELDSFTGAITKIAQDNKLKHYPSVEVIRHKKQLSAPLGESKEKAMINFVNKVLSKTLMLIPYEIRLN